MVVTNVVVMVVNVRGSDESGDGGAEMVAVLVAGVKDGVVNVVVMVA